ncbi:hypothetical protein BJV77DRAFT_1061467 [Russula vinacea]|nr:hypothetical protein BJV77DRAFT_1061467 [Russula vinacea]
MPVARSTPPSSSAKERSRPKPPPPPDDYSCPVQGMYRLLDLITELGSSGLGNCLFLCYHDKIVIAQQTLQAFINTLSPGAYASITKVNFKKLDKCSLKPLGFLREVHAVDDKTYPILRSGLYVVRSFVSTAEEQAYVVYWPEDTTWDDQAISTVQRNRVTFMRYLTKLCDQIVCLLSSEHSKAIVWGDEDGDDASTDSDNDDSGRLYDFVVAKTNDQEENVVAKPGFKDLSPRLLYGEIMQGFMTAKFKKAETLVDSFVHRDLSISQMRLLLGDDVVLCLSEKIDDKSLETLMKLGPSDRFPKEFATWERHRKEITQRFQGTRTERQKEMHTMLERNFEDTKVNIQEGVIIEGIKGTEFQIKKERILILYHLLENTDGLNSGQIPSLADAVLTRRDKQAVLGLLKVAMKEDKGSTSGGIIGTAKDVAYATKERVKSTLGISKSPETSREEAIWREANNFASSVSDSRFLQQLSSAPVDEYLHDAVAETEEAAYVYLKKLIKSLVDGIGQQIFSIQKAECDKQIEREINSEQDKELEILRSELVNQVEDLSRERSRSPRSLHIDKFGAKKENYYSPGLLIYPDQPKAYLNSLTVSYSIKGRQESQQNQEIEYHVHTLRLRTEQKHNLQLDPSFVPTPILNERLSQSFRVSSDTIVKYAHLLEGDRILVGLVDAQGNVIIFLDKLSRIDTAIKNKSHAKFFHQDKIGQTCLFAFDESKRMLAVPASLQLSHIPRAIYSSPDGSCVLAVQEEDGQSTVTAYHWSTFASTNGISVTLLISLERQQKTLVFVSNGDGRPFSPHFSDLIHTFERASRKPTGDELRGISVSACTFPSFAREFLSSPDWAVSRFRAGEWLADLLCLIPIHIAITHENRFVPLKDGVVSAQLEKSLLGAEVNKIVDSLSLGWYESIFQSYWASKPVKVVSSMGEQSVGKSFTLNHLVDTSFAGSAMRTTEGVWMSVSPTDDALIVALDFEGERPQSRTFGSGGYLLVLFNTAISNLVLFRNNFALSRDITGLFQSFQSSSSVLDPTSNPSLFQSTLVVIIKDVIDSDKAEVTREFSLKFQKIVQDEQDANFITRLHAGKLQIIPWPVIESKEFYKLFSALKRKLDQQATSHYTAGEFLHTLKTLMAKLKANDWGAMSQTMAAHRANTLLAILSNALETGYSEVYPDREPLKNFDTDLVIEAEDTEAQFLLAGPDAPVADRESCLGILRESWDQISSRQRVEDSEWTTDLAQYLTHLVDLRAAHVDKWLKSNIYEPASKFAGRNVGLATFLHTESCACRWSRLPDES